MECTLLTSQNLTNEHFEMLVAKFAVTFMLTHFILLSTPHTLFPIKSTLD